MNGRCKPESEEDWLESAEEEDAEDGLMLTQALPIIWGIIALMGLVVLWEVGIK